MSSLNENGKVVFTAPVSTMVRGSLECGQYQGALRWPGQHGMYNFPLDQLARRFYEKDRLEFFCMREILFHGKESGAPMRMASLDPVFGVRMLWPYPARKGERYVFTFIGEPPPQPPAPGMPVNDLELPDFVLINGRRFFERESGAALYFTVEYIAAADGPMEITLVKDQMKTWRDCQKWWKGQSLLTAPICHMYTHMHMGLQFACEHFGPVSAAPTSGSPFNFPDGLRTFMNPGVWRWVPDEDELAYDYQPVPVPDYPTDGVVYNQFHDLYLDQQDKAALTPGIMQNRQAIRDIIRLSLDNGIRCFPQYEVVLEELENMGLAADPTITIFFSGGYIKRVRGAEKDTLAAQDARQKDEGARLAAVMRRFLNSPVIYRLNEFSGCQYHYVTALPEDRERAWAKPWYAFAAAADQINREALDNLLAEGRELDAARLSVAANVQTGHLAARPLHCGADFVLAKTIGRNQVNLVIADSRGVNTSFARRIGLQHDAWGALNYNRDSSREIEAVHRSFFFNGGEFHDAEFGNYALNQENRGVFNLKGMAWIKITRLAAIHPRRGRQQVKIAFMRGSDNVWSWYYPIKHTMGLRNFDQPDPADPKEFIDFNLLNIAFPEIGDCFSNNPERWLTGTPYGPCNLLPWDAPADALSRHDVIVMLGANRMQPEQYANYRTFVEQGGRLVLGLYQLLAPDFDRVYCRNDLSDLLGLRLGDDISLMNPKTLAERQAFVSQHYNRIELAGAEVIERLPDGAPLLTRFKLGKGEAYFFTTDRLLTVPGHAEKLIRGLFNECVPMELEPGNDRMEIAVSARDDLRIITLMDHGRDRLPTDAGADTGPYCGKAWLDVDNLDLPEDEYEVMEVFPDKTVSRLETRNLPTRPAGRRICLDIDGMGAYLELVLAPVGTARRKFFSV